MPIMSLFYSAAIFMQIFHGGGVGGVVLKVRENGMTVFRAIPRSGALGQA